MAPKRSRLATTTPEDDAHPHAPGEVLREEFVKPRHVGRRSGAGAPGTRGGGQTRVLAQFGGAYDLSQAQAEVGVQIEGDMTRARLLSREWLTGSLQQLVIIGVRADPEPGYDITFVQP